MFETNIMCLNEFRGNLAANLDRSPLIHSYCYASAGDQSTFADMDVAVRRPGARAMQEQFAAFAIFPPDLNHRDVMYASNAGAFTCPPFIQHAGER